MVTYENGENVNEEVLSSEIIVKPLEEVIYFGTKERWDPADRYRTDTTGLDYEEVLNVEATAYTHTGNTTYTGIWPYEGIVAVDPKIIPLKSKLFVEGYGFAEAQDTGGLIKGNIIDVFMDTREKALNWGRKQVKVYILETPEN
jgi:3D (Asp-Asp-Asp) domain-containing protein